MSRFSKPPKDSTIHKELLIGRIWCRQGHRGRATMLLDRETKQFVVMTGHAGPQRSFRSFFAAVKFFNLTVGKVKA